jgi:hypothetical protein
VSEVTTIKERSKVRMEFSHWLSRRHIMTKKFVGLIAVLVCHATVTSSENATAASTPQTKTQMPAAHPMSAAPPVTPKANVTQPVHDRKEFLLNIKMNSQGAVKGKSTRETSTPINGATVVTTKIHPSSLTNKVDPSTIDQVGAPPLNASSKDAAQMPVLKAFPPFSFDSFGAAGKVSAASVTRSEEAGGTGKVIVNSFSTRKSYAPPVWAPGSDASKESTTFVYGGLSLSPNGSAMASVLRVDGARTENVSGSNTITISGARTETADGSNQITPRTTRTEKVSGSNIIAIGGARDGNGGSSNQITPGIARPEDVGGSNPITVNGARTDSAGSSNQTIAGTSRTENVRSSNTATVGGARDENDGSSTKDLSDTSSLNLQRGTDDRSKLLQTLPDTQKSKVDTDNGIVKKIK